jgi:hypothetical protein
VKVARQWCVVWRNGNPDSFTWERSDAMSREAADSSREAFERDGTRALVVDHAQSVSIGLPEGWGK